jgi:hypothetical protein
LEFHLLLISIFHKHKQWNEQISIYIRKWYKIINIHLKLIFEVYVAFLWIFC